MKLFILSAIQQKRAVKLTFVDGTQKVFNTIGQEYGENHIEFLYGQKPTQILINLNHVIKAEVVDHHIQQASC